MNLMPFEQFKDSRDGGRKKYGGEKIDQDSAFVEKDWMIVNKFVESKFDIC